MSRISMIELGYRLALENWVITMGGCPDPVVFDAKTAFADIVFKRLRLERSPDFHKG